MKNKYSTFLIAWLLLLLPSILWAQAIEVPTAFFLMHSSGHHLAKAADGGGVLEAADSPSPQTITFIPQGDGYYALRSSDATGYLSLSGSWNTVFTEAPLSDNALYAIESNGNTFIKLRCKANGKYLGTDGTAASSKVYSDKDGTDMKMLSLLVSRRCEEMKQTVLACNSDNEEMLSGILGESIVDRFHSAKWKAHVVGLGNNGKRPRDAELSAAKEKKDG